MTGSNPERFLNPLEALQAYHSQDQPPNNLSNPTQIMDEELGEDHVLFLNNLFGECHSVKDLPKGHFHLNQGELGEIVLRSQSWDSYNTTTQSQTIWREVSAHKTVHSP